MANQEQLEILKQGVEVWNKWRDNNPDVDVDLSEAHLIEASLKGVDLTRANLSRALLLGAYLCEAELRQANLSEVNLRQATLIQAQLSGATLLRAYLGRANLSQANLREADLRMAHLNEANFNSAYLMGSNLAQAEMGYTIFGDSDLSKSIGLEAVIHAGPSTIGTNTLVLSKGKISEVFLRGCGLSDWEIGQVKLYNPELSNEEINNIQYKMYDLRASQALQISPLFISYGHADGAFVDKIGNSLTKKGIRYWRDIHDLKAGRMEEQIDRVMRLNPIVLLILSEHSIKSDWVEHEVRTARELEKELGRDVLCPVALDDSWKNHSPWEKHLMEQVKKYNILDFSAWKDDSKFGNMFRKLIDGLELFYKG